MSDKSDLKTISGIGDDMKRHLLDIGIKTVEDLVGKNPEELYLKDMAFRGRPADKCVLYVFRLAVYYAENKIRDPDKLKGWYRKDKECGALQSKRRKRPVTLSRFTFHVKH